MPVECDYCLGNAEDDEIYVNECSGFSGSCWGHVCDNCCWETNRLVLCPPCYTVHIRKDKPNSDGLLECTVCDGQGDAFLPDYNDRDFQGPGLKVDRAPVGFTTCWNCEGTGKVKANE